MKWGELEARGIRRCGARFTDGKRCAARVEADAVDVPMAKGGSQDWCAHHAEIFERRRRMSADVSRGMK